MNFKKPIYYIYIFAITLLSGLLLSTPKFTQAQQQATPTPMPTKPVEISSSPADEEKFSLELLGFSEQTLIGPFDSKLLRFYLPLEWQVSDGSLELNLTVFQGGVGFAPAENGGEIRSGKIEVSLNGAILDTITLDHDGQYQVSIPIPAALISNQPDGQQNQLRISLDSGLSCEFDNQTSVVIHPTSHFILPHQVVAPKKDLRLFPRPFYQQSFVPDVVTIVVPNEPTSSELQAALSIAAGLGKITAGALDELELVPFNQLPKTTRDAGHMIFVGKAASFIAALRQTPFPVAELKKAQMDDGVVQMTVSPWNSTRVILWVSGNTDAGVVKAGQAVSSQILRVGSTPELAFVQDIHPADEEVNNDLNQLLNVSLVDLGYTTNQLNLRGTNWAEYEFFVPPNHITTSDAYIDLVYNHSATLGYEESGLDISLNDETFRNIRFNDESQNRTEQRIVIPRHLVRSGKNRLTIRAQLEPKNVCINPSLYNLWLNIWPESILNVPLVPNQAHGDTTFDLNQYPEPFVFNPTLANTAFVLSRNNPAAWQAAAQLAYNLGKQREEPLAELMVTYDNNIPKDRHLLVVGRASQLPLITELKESLPAPFEPDSDYAIEKNVRVIYRFPQGADIGYIELLPAPWDKREVIIAVLGSTDTGLNWATQAMITPDLRGQLAGNFAVVSDEQIVVGNISSNSSVRINPTVTATLATSEVITLTAPVSVSNNVNEMSNINAQQISDRSAWILPTLFGSISIMVVIITIVAVSALRRRTVG